MCFFFLLAERHMCDLSPWPGIKLCTACTGRWRLNHQTAREVPLPTSWAFVFGPQNRETANVCYLKSPSLRSFVMVTPGNEPASSLMLTSASLGEEQPVPATRLCSMNPGKARPLLTEAPVLWLGTGSSRHPRHVCWIRSVCTSHWVCFSFSWNKIKINRTRHASLRLKAEGHPGRWCSEAAPCLGTLGSSLKPAISSSTAAHRHYGPDPYVMSLKCWMWNVNWAGNLFCWFT